MPAGLPSKTCEVCGLPFNWRKKWKNNWDEIKYCSERCRRNKKSTSSGIPKSENKKTGIL